MKKLDESLKETGFVGYAELYLQTCSEESGSDDQAEIEAYKKLVELEARLGTELSEQLYGCLRKTSRWDIIKV